MEFKYNYEYPTFDNLSLFIDENRALYAIRKNELEYTYNEILKSFDLTKYVGLIEEKRNLDFYFLKRIIEFFWPVIKDKSPVVFLHGSYAKGVNRWLSDIDLNILFINGENDIVIEELICAIIVRIFGLSGRDKIHTMMLYVPYEDDYNEIDYSNESSILFSAGNMINYKYRENYESVFHKLIYSSRKISVFSNYINSFHNKNEWEYSFCPLLDDNYCEVLNVLRKKMSTVNYLSIISNIKDIVNVKYSPLCFETISEFNKLIKVNNLGYIYKFIFILNMYLVINCLEYKKDDLNVCDVLENNYLIDKFGLDFVDLKNSIYKYIWFVDRVENLSSKLKLNFSSRENLSYSKEKFCGEYKEFYLSDLDSDYKVFENVIIKCREILERINNEYK